MLKYNIDCWMRVYDFHYQMEQGHVYVDLSETVDDGFAADIVGSMCRGYFISPIIKTESSVTDGQDILYVIEKALYEGNYAFFNVETGGITINSSNVQYEKGVNEYDVKDLYDTFTLVRMLDNIKDKTYVKRMTEINSNLQQCNLCVVTYSMLSMKQTSI